MELTEQDKARLAEVRRAHPLLAAFVDEVRAELAGKVLWVAEGAWSVGKRPADEGVSIVASWEDGHAR